MVRAVAVETASVIQSIFSQVQRGHYSFVLFRVHKGIGEDAQKWFLSSYGMETENFTTLLRNKYACLLYTSPSPRDMRRSRMPSSA